MVWASLGRRGFLVTRFDDVRSLRLMMHSEKKLNARSFILVDAILSVSDRLLVTCLFSHDAVPQELLPEASHLRAEPRISSPLSCQLSAKRSTRRHQRDLLVMVGPSNKQSTKAKTGLFDLPPELREEIYR